MSKQIFTPAQHGCLLRIPSCGLPALSAHSVNLLHCVVIMSNSVECMHMRCAQGNDSVACPIPRAHRLRQALLAGSRRQDALLTAPILTSVTCEEKLKASMLFRSA